MNAAGPGLSRAKPVVLALIVLGCGALAVAQPSAGGEEVAEEGAVGAVGRHAPRPQEPEPEYVGSRACRRCHLREYRSWQGTAHANIFTLLEPGVRPDAKRKVNLQPDVDYRTNELCLQCHTVGYGTPSGFKSLEETPDLIGVGCETCHGPGSIYIQDDVMGNDNLDHSFDEVFAAGLIYPVPDEVCRQCHTNPATPFNPEHFPEYAFEYERETVAAGSHEHRPLTREHGELPPGVMFQDSGR